MGGVSFAFSLDAASLLAILFRPVWMRHCAIDDGVPRARFDFFDESHVSHSVELVSNRAVVRVKVFGELSDRAKEVAIVALNP
jgi:hypothetical protein